MSGVDVGVYLVTDTALAARSGQSVRRIAEHAVAAGVRTVQVRDKDASARELFALVASVAGAVGARATVVVDDRLDVALAARAAGHLVAGVHLGQSDVPAEAARTLLGPTAHVGLTANTPEHLAEVARMPHGTVDLLGVGVVHPTTTKADHPPALGVDGFARIAAATPLPCVAIGGIGLADVSPLRAAGAAGVAVVSGICGAPRPAAAAAAFVAAWDDGGRRGLGARQHPSAAPDGSRSADHGLPADASTAGGGR